MTGYLRFLRRQHSEAIRYARASGWNGPPASYWRGQAVGYRIATVAYIARIRIVREEPAGLSEPVPHISPSEETKAWRP